MKFIIKSINRNRTFIGFYPVCNDCRTMGSIQRTIGPNIIGQRDIIRFYSSKSLTKIEKDSFSITPHLNEVLIGLTLGGIYLLVNLREILRLD